MEPIKIISVSDKMQAEMIIEILQNNNIPAYGSEQGPGEYMNIYSGFSVFGTDIYVAEENAERAMGILKELEPEEESEEIDKQEEKQKTKFYRNKAYVARMMIGIIVVTTVLIMIVGYIL